MTVTIRKKRGEVRGPHPSVVCDNSISKRKSSRPDFNTSLDSCRDEDDDDFVRGVNTPYRSPALRTPADSTASWLDAEECCRNGAEFLDEATSILHDEGEFSDLYHDQLRVEYEQWKKIPHLRVIGKKIDCPNTPRLDLPKRRNVTNDDERTMGDSVDDTERRLHELRDQVFMIMMESIWLRVLDERPTTGCRQLSHKDSVLPLYSPCSIESTLVVSPILPADRPRIKSKTRLNVLPATHQPQRNIKYNQKPWSKNNVTNLPPIEIHPKKITDKTKRWFSAVGAPGRNHVPSRPATSAFQLLNSHTEDTPTINVRFDISIDGKSIKGLRKKSFYHNNNDYRSSSIWPRSPK
ncbi:uncharacterized protein LOC126838806 isoform X3 [Adelges cooleyi]|uniref:uncharacterized protein LOC126838806 isoform X3 n=1 Tax=Adelges cooleyi TaxID=133065 RepID=UPI00217F8151|nr:uncharacterized protein LOC126838806 isoform X3 [Adelges cooleyi]